MLEGGGEGDTVDEAERVEVVAGMTEVWSVVGPGTVEGTGPVLDGVPSQTGGPGIV